MLCHPCGWSWHEAGRRLEGGWKEAGRRLEGGWEEVGMRLEGGWEEAGIQVRQTATGTESKRSRQGCQYVSPASSLIKQHRAALAQTQINLNAWKKGCDALDPSSPQRRIDTSREDSSRYEG